MKILLAAINAKFIHSNPAVYSLKAAAGLSGAQVEIGEYTINQNTDHILQDIYRKQPDVVAFSCYIWNRRMVGASGGAAGRPAVGRRPGSHLGCGRVSGSVPGDVGNHAGRRGRNLLPAGDILYRRRGFALRDPGTDLPGRGRADP